MKLTMNKVVEVALIVCLNACQIQSINTDQECSVLNYVEKTLDKVIRYETSAKLMMTDFQSISKEVTGELEKIKHEATEMKTGFTALKQEIMEKMQAEIVAYQTAIQDLNGQLHRPSYAFSAYSQSEESPAVGDTLVFTIIQLDENGVYDTGIFTAPVSGTYMFSATLCTWPNKFVYAHFVADETIIGATSSGDPILYACSSGFAMARLPKGARVFLKVAHISTGPAIKEDEYRRNTYSGHKID